MTRALLTMHAITASTIRQHANHHVRDCWNRPLLPFLSSSNASTKYQDEMRYHNFCVTVNDVGHVRRKEIGAKLRGEASNEPIHLYVARFARLSDKTIYVIRA